jgi:hypothetical protein
MRLAVGDEFQRKRAFIGGSGEQDAHGVRHREPYALEHGGRAVPYVSVDSGLDKRICGHDRLLSKEM